MVTIAIAAHKGGVAKTTTTHTLGTLLSEPKRERRRVLMIDADPQGSLSGACGLTDDASPTLADVLNGNTSMTEAIHPLSDTLAILPATVDLADVELDMVARAGRESMLKRALARLTNFDVCLIDCGPGIGILTLNALVAARGVIVPTQPQAQDLRGLNLILRTIDAVRTELNPSLELIGILPTFFSAQLQHHIAALQEIKANKLNVLYPIGRSIRVAEAAAAGQPVTEYAPENPRAHEYRQLAREVERWLKRNQA